MKILVRNNTIKIFHAKGGNHKAFGRNVDERRNMNDEQLIILFDEVWKNHIHELIENASICNPDDVRQRLSPQQLKFFDANQEHREFWLYESLLVAQLNQEDEESYELTQLWFIKSSNVDPRTLFITFDTLKIKEDFKSLAASLGYEDEELGKELILEFMNKFSRTNHDK